jgi:transcription elongation factor GreA
MGGKELFEYKLVGSGEANPAERKISNESPLGVALLGKKRGQRVKTLTPNGEIEYTIIEVV